MGNESGLCSHAWEHVEALEQGLNKVHSLMLSEVKVSMWQGTGNHRQNCPSLNHACHVCSRFTDLCNAPLQV